MNDSMIIRENQQPRACLHMLAWINVLCCGKRNQIYPESRKKIKPNHHLRINSLYVFIGEKLYNNPYDTDLIKNLDYHEDTSCNVNDMFTNNWKKMVKKVN